MGCGRSALEVQRPFRPLAGLMHACSARISALPASHRGTHGQRSSLAIVLFLCKQTLFAQGSCQCEARQAEHLSSPFRLQGAQSPTPWLPLHMLSKSRPMTL